MTTRGLRPERFQVVMSSAEFADIDDYHYAARCSSKADALRQLALLSLGATEKPERHDQALETIAAERTREGRPSLGQAFEDEQLRERVREERVHISFSHDELGRIDKYRLWAGGISRPDAVRELAAMSLKGKISELALQVMRETAVRPPRLDFLRLNKDISHEYS